MSEIPPSNFGAYTFLPWLRRGISTGVTAAEGPRATAKIRVSIEDQEETSIDLALYGPGEVAGIDPRVIIRTYPPPEVFNAEPNYFPLIEFDQPDMPWRYTPAPVESDRLRPWLVLIVLADGEYESREAILEEGALPAINVFSTENLPNLSQSWAWAHVQVTDFDAKNEKVAQIIETEPYRILSRLMCPRCLEPGMTYTAFLVPSFERGRLAGLNEEMDESVGGMAWESNGATVTLPVYYQWRFGTGEAGDFESLARRLRWRDVRGDVGTRKMDISELAGIPLIEASVDLEGALMLPSHQGDEWIVPGNVLLLSALQDRLNCPAKMLAEAGVERAVAPPLYGRWLAACDRLEIGIEPEKELIFLYELGRRAKRGPVRKFLDWMLESSQTPEPLWFHELNADPRFRVAASLGTRFVQEQQHQLMASAWEQVEGVLEINDKLRQAQLAREAATRIHERHIKP